MLTVFLARLADGICNFNLKDRDAVYDSYQPVCESVGYLVSDVAKPRCFTELDCEAAYRSFSRMCRDATLDPWNWWWCCAWTRNDTTPYWAYFDNGCHCKGKMFYMQHQISYVETNCRIHGGTIGGGVIQSREGGEGWQTWNHYASTCPQVTKGLARVYDNFRLTNTTAADLGGRNWQTVESVERDIISIYKCEAMVHVPRHPRVASAKAGQTKG